VFTVVEIWVVVLCVMIPTLMMEAIYSFETLITSVTIHNNIPLHNPENNIPGRNMQLYCSALALIYVLLRHVLL
jgi:hypothetical protein